MVCGRPVYGDERMFDTVTYRNDTTGVNIVFSPRDNDIEVELIRLFHGEELDFLWYGERRVNLSLLLRFRAAVVTDWYKEWPDPINAEDIKRILRECAAELRTHAADILEGDFSHLPRRSTRAIPLRTWVFASGSLRHMPGPWSLAGPKGQKVLDVTIGLYRQYRDELDARLARQWGTKEWEKILKQEAARRVLFETLKTHARDFDQRHRKELDGTSILAYLLEVITVRAARGAPGSTRRPVRAAGNPHVGLGAAPSAAGRPVGRQRRRSLAGHRLQTNGSKPSVQRSRMVPDSSPKNGRPQRTKMLPDSRGYLGRPRSYPLVVGSQLSS